MNNKSLAHQLEELRTGFMESIEEFNSRIPEKDSDLDRKNPQHMFDYGLLVQAEVSLEVINKFIISSKLYDKKIHMGLEELEEKMNYEAALNDFEYEALCEKWGK